MAFGGISCMPGKERLSELFEEFLEEEGLEVVQKIPAEDDWARLKKAVLSLYHRNKLNVNEMDDLHGIVKNLQNSKTGQFMFEWCQDKAFKEGAKILHESITENKERNVLLGIEDVWVYFYGEIVPALQAIFSELSSRSQKLTIRQAALVTFRNGISLQFNLEELLTPKTATPAIRQMLLVLQSVQDTYPPNAERDTLEKLVARAIVPYMGYHGYYNGSPELVIESKEPQIRRRSSGENKRLSRPLSAQPNTIETFTDLVRTAAARTSSLSDV